MKGKAAQRQLLVDRAEALGKCIKRVQEEVAYIKGPPQLQLDTTCQRLALYAVLDDYVYAARDCDFPPLPELKGMEKAVLRERNVASGAGPLLERQSAASASAPAPAPAGPTRGTKRGREEAAVASEDEKEEERPARSSRSKPAATAAATATAKKAAAAASTSTHGKKTAAAPAPAPRRSSRR